MKMKLIDPAAVAAGSQPVLCIMYNFFNLKKKIKIVNLKLKQEWLLSK